VKHSAEGKLLTEIILGIFKLNGLLITEGDQLINGLGLSSARWKVLGAISESDRPMTVPDIARMMGQSRQAVQRLSNEMKEEGLLETKNNPGHKRAKLLALTDEGKSIYAEVEQLQIPWVNSIADEIETTDLKHTSSVLQRIITRLER
jgi:DNA-binding MarR family transcriptional regulator